MCFWNFLTILHSKKTYHGQVCILFNDCRLLRLNGIDGRWMNVRINMQHWWNNGDSDIQLEYHSTVSSFLVKLLNGEWRGIHHGYCQNVLKYYRHMSLWLSNMSAASHSSKRNPQPKTQNHSHVISRHTPFLCFQMPCPPVTLITRHTVTVTITYIIPCVLPSWRIFYFNSSIYNLEPTLYISQSHKTTRKNDQVIYF